MRTVDHGRKITPKNGHSKIIENITVNVLTVWHS